MKTKVISITLLTGISLVLTPRITSGESKYNAEAAVNYANLWFDDRNPDYKDYGQDDCANFVSQCLIEGGLDLSVHPGADPCGSIPKCTNLHDYLVSSNYLCDPKFKGQVEPDWFLPGDVAIFGYTDKEGDVHTYAHSVIAVTGDATHYATCNAHSIPTNDYPKPYTYHASIEVIYLANPSFDRCTFYQISVGTEEPVYFADAILKAAVEEALGISDPTPTDMLALTTLAKGYGQIDDITGLEYATNLTWLYLEGCPISDISGLSGLTSLTSLGLPVSQISNISALSGLTNLTNLDLYDNKISDISPLSGLTNLTWLHLGENQISNISALSGLTNLTWLLLWHNPLNEDAYNIYIPQILENNPGIYFLYDPWTNPDRIVAKVCSPVELRVYDSQGRITGLLEGEEKNEIPNSTYFENTVTIFVPTDTYYYEVAGTDQGAYGLNITSVIGGEAVNFEATNLPTSYGTVHQYTIEWDALCTGEEGVTLKIDSDGDGAFEQIVIADNDLSYYEFALQTETVIDFEPDTLNLKSEGKFATVYIELPEGFDVSEIDISSLTLNESVTALPKPIAIGDYDSDGTNDLMVKFDLQELIEVLEPGEQIIDLTGRLSDDRPLAGFDMIRVIH